MQLRVYNGEYFQRSHWWYGIFIVVVLGLVVLSFVWDNWFWALFLLVLAGGYWYFQSKIDDVSLLEMTDTGLKLWDRFFPYANLQGFLFEWDVKTGKILNLVLVFTKHSEVFTIADQHENIEEFAHQLNRYLPLLEKYDQSTIDKIMRKLKI